MAGYFDAKEAIACAATLAEDFHDLLVNRDHQGNSRKEGKHTKRLVALVDRAAAFSQTHRLNFYKKSKFLAALKFRLRDLGHSAAEIDGLLQALLPKL